MNEGAHVIVAMPFFRHRAKEPRNVMHEKISDARAASAWTFSAAAGRKGLYGRNGEYAPCSEPRLGGDSFSAFSERRAAGGEAGAHIWQKGALSSGAKASPQRRAWFRRRLAGPGLAYGA